MYNPLFLGVVGKIWGNAAWLIAGSRYANKSKDVSSEISALTNAAFSLDGTKMYAVGSTNDTVYQYTLSTAWDVSTASYASKSFSVNTQEAVPNDVDFSVDGTKMYIVGSNSDTVYQYTLSTPWDVSTASYASKSFSVSAWEGSSAGFYFRGDGKKMYLVGVTNDTVYQYSLSTAWDISTASYDSKSKSVSAEDVTPRGIALSSDGLKLYIAGATNDKVFQYTLSTAWDISTASYDSESKDVSSETTAPRMVEFKGDGTKVYVGDLTNDIVYQYNVSDDTAWNALSLEYESKSMTFSEGTAPRTPYFKDDGTKMYILGGTNDTVYQYTMSTPWDISTASYDSKSKSVSAEEATPQAMSFSTDGTKMYIAGQTNDTIYQYTLSTAWDVSTASYASKSKSVSSENGYPASLSFKSDGTKVYVGGLVTDSVFQYSLSVAWDISTATYDSKSKDVSALDGSVRSWIFNPDGTMAYLLGKDNASVFQYSLSTAWDISTAIFARQEKDVSSEDLSPSGIFFNTDGTKMYMAGNTNDKIFQYKFGS